MKYEKCSVISLPVEKSKLYYESKTNTYHYRTVVLVHKHDTVFPLNLFVTTKDEIRVDDWAHHEERNIIFKVKEVLENHFVPYDFENLKLTPTKTKCTKIAASTNVKLGLPKIPTLFINDWCDSVGSIDEVLVEYEEVLDMEQIGKNILKLVPKIVPDNTITLKELTSRFDGIGVT